MTDPATPLASLAGADGFRRLFENRTDIGGRYSVLSHFGLVPAAAIGVDVARLLERANDMAARCDAALDVPSNPGAWLGAMLGSLALKGRDKLTIVASPSVASFGLWIEQLIAESTGKDGTGIVPIAGEPVGSPDGTKITYIQGTAGKYAGYGSSQVAVLPIAAGAPTSASPTLPSEALDRSVSNLRWSLDGQTLFFGFDDDRERFVGSVPAVGGEIERRKLAESALATSIVNAFEVGRKGIAVLATSPTHPPEIFRLGDGLALSDHNRALREQIAWAKVRGIDVTSKDGTRVGAMLYEPPRGQRGKPLPTIAFIHGGPFGQDAYEFDWMAQSLAATGYLVVQPNYRGSSGRGADFSRTLYAKWADGVQDIHAVMDYLVAEGLSDPKRLGIGGWSYGGINTNYAIATDTRFKAAVSGPSITNLVTGYGTDQYIRQYEGELGKAWVEEDLARYLELSFPFFHADRIQTPTLFMCGEKDFNVPLINSEQMYMALRSLGIPTELVIYPGQYHWPSVPSYLEDLMVRWIAWYDAQLSG